MVSTKKVSRSGQCIYSVYYLLVISRNNSNTFLLIDLQKTKLFQSKILKEGLFLTDLTGFCPLPDVYFNNMQLSRWQNF